LVFWIYLVCLVELPNQTNETNQMNHHSLSGAYWLNRPVETYNIAYAPRR